MYIHELREWPNFDWNQDELLEPLANARQSLAALAHELSLLGFDEKAEASLRMLTEEVVHSSAIEGEVLDPGLVRSSIARRLGLPEAGVAKEDRNVEGIVAVVLDATQKCNEPVSKERLCSWHAALFPTGYSGFNKIIVGDWRDDKDGPMQVVSGPEGKWKVHFEAPGSLRLPAEMAQFLHWFKDSQEIDPILKAGIAHFYFVTIHPFADGNGRIARAIADLVLARADNLKQRYYSMSAQIGAERKAYYETLEATQRGTLDITSWLQWFLGCLARAIEGAEKVLHDMIQKVRVWQYLTGREINNRQQKILNALLDDTFFGVLNSAKYVKMTHCSADTANRDLSQLVDYGVLERTGKGRATKYMLKKLHGAEPNPGQSF